MVNHIESVRDSFRAPGSPLVSVIVPTHNRCQLLRETVASVLAQTMRDFELIIVSDGSTDGTRTVIETIGDPRIVFVEQSPSGRPAVPRNRGLILARGKYIALCDDDDLWRVEKLAKQVALMERDPSLGLCYTNSVTLRNGRTGAQPRLKSGEYVRDFNELLWRNYICNSSVVAPRRVFEAVGPFDEEPLLCPFDDYEMWLRVAHRFPIAYIDEPLVVYRVHDSNIVSRFAERELIVIRVLRTVMKKLQTHRIALGLSIALRFGKYLASALRGHKYRVR